MSVHPIPSLLIPAPTLALALALAGTLAAQTHPAPAAGAHEARAFVARTPAFRASTGRPANMVPPATNMILLPGATPRAMVMPQAAFWPQRDIMGEIQAIARQGFIAVTPVAMGTSVVTDFTFVPAGWKAYAFAVPGREQLHVRLHHDHEGWFRLMMVNHWGLLEAGMLQNLIPTGNPEVTFKNPSNAPHVVYVIVDDPGWMSDRHDPYVLNIDRSWDPAAKPVPGIPNALGIWATRKPKPEASTPEPVPAPAPAPAKS